jgi:Flp pilus assembly pilin Flp
MTRELLVRFRALIAREDGQDLIEYALLCSLIAMAAVAALGSVGETLTTLWWEPVSDAFSGL